jgi:hypothetical protein
MKLRHAYASSRDPKVGKPRRRHDTNQEGDIIGVPSLGVGLSLEPHGPGSITAAVENIARLGVENGGALRSDLILSFW